MHLYTSHVNWSRGSQPFIDNLYSRRHTISFDGGVVVPGSSSPFVVRVPMSDPSAVDPEESFVSSLSSCHMLWFLSIAAARKFCVDSYSDRAEGVMAKNGRGKLAMSVVKLHPHVVFSGTRSPTQAEFLAMNHEAHEECFIANSVLADVQCDPTMELAT